MDDTLFFSPKQEYIDEVIHCLQHEQGMDLEVEQDVARFLGVHLECSSLDGSVTLTQTGLIKQIIDSLGVGNDPIKVTPAKRELLVLDQDGNPPNATYSYASVIGMIQ
jgi:hypothetical protein